MPKHRAVVTQKHLFSPWMPLCHITRVLRNG